jgi:hypothetical protein
MRFLTFPKPTRGKSYHSFMISNWIVSMIIYQTNNISIFVLNITAQSQRIYLIFYINKWRKKANSWRPSLFKGSKFWTFLCRIKQKVGRKLSRFWFLVSFPFNCFELTFVPIFITFYFGHCKNFSCLWSPFLIAIAGILLRDTESTRFKNEW